MVQQVLELQILPDHQVVHVHPVGEKIMFVHEKYKTCNKSPIKIHVQDQKILVGIFFTDSAANDPSTQRVSVAAK